MTAEENNQTATSSDVECSMTDDADMDERCVDMCDSDEVFFDSCCEMVCCCC